MKKSVFLMLLTALVLGFSSCGDSDVYNYYENQDVIQRTLSVGSREWVKMQSENMPVYYAATFQISELNYRVFNTGIVSCEIVLGDSRQPLPYSTHYMNGQGEMWTRTIDFQYKVGEVTIFVTNNDFFDELPESMNFRLSIISEGDDH